MSAAVARGGEVVWTGCVGTRSPDAELRASSPDTTPDAPEALDATPETAYRVGSITKPMVAAALLRLVDDGRLGLGDAVGSLLPDAPVPEGTVAQYLSHTSGLGAETTGPWWERVPGPTWAELTGMWPERVFRPGRRCRYSNVGYAAVGQLLATLTGLTWDDAVRELIWEPLGMTGTGRTPVGEHATEVAVHPYAEAWHPEPVPDYRAMGPAGEVWSTPSDLVRFGSFLLGFGPHADLLSDEIRGEMTEPLALWDGPGAPWVSSQGLGVVVGNDGGRRWYGHSGSVPGFTADLRADVASTYVVAVVGNATRGHGGAESFMATLRATEPADPGPFRLERTQGSLVDLTGIWYWGPEPMLVQATRGGSLNLKSIENPDVPNLFIGDGDEWVCRSGGYFVGARLRVIRDTEGRAHHLDVGSFRLTRSPYDPASDIPGGVDEHGWR